MVERVLVTGATCKSGMALVRLLREMGVATRRPQHPDDVRFDWGDASTFDAALEGVDAVYLVAPTNSVASLAAMRAFSMARRDELVGVLRERYGSADRADRGRILDEFVVVTGCHRKHAMRVLRAGAPRRPASTRPQRRICDNAARQALVMAWEAADRICGRRLKGKRCSGPTLLADGLLLISEL